MWRKEYLQRHFRRMYIFFSIAFFTRKRPKMMISSSSSSPSASSRAKTDGGRLEGLELNSLYLKCELSLSCGRESMKDGTNIRAFILLSKQLIITRQIQKASHFKQKFEEQRTIYKKFQNQSLYKNKRISMRWYSYLQIQENHQKNQELQENTQSLILNEKSNRNCSFSINIIYSSILINKIKLIGHLMKNKKNKCKTQSAFVFDQQISHFKVQQLLDQPPLQQTDIKSTEITIPKAQIHQNQFMIQQKSINNTQPIIPPPNPQNKYQSSRLQLPIQQPKPKKTNRLKTQTANLFTKPSNSSTTPPIHTNRPTNKSRLDDFKKQLINRDQISHPLKYKIVVEQLGYNPQKIYKLKNAELNNIQELYQKQKGLQYLKQSRITHSNKPKIPLSRLTTEPTPSVTDPARSRSYIHQIFGDKKIRKIRSSSQKTLHQKHPALEHLQQKQDILGKLVYTRVKNHLNNEHQTNNFYQRVHSQQAIDQALIEFLKLKIERAETSLKIV